MIDRVSVVREGGHRIWEQKVRLAKTTDGGLFHRKPTKWINGLSKIIYKRRGPAAKCWSRLEIQDFLSKWNKEKIDINKDNESQFIYLTMLLTALRALRALNALLELIPPNRDGTVTFSILLNRIWNFKQLHNCTSLLFLNTNSSMCGWMCPPHQQAILRNQQGVLQVNLILTLSPWK